MRWWIVLWVLFGIATHGLQAQSIPGTDFVQAEISDKQAYVGQALRYTMRYYLAFDAPGDSEAAQFIRPDFAGFGLSSQDIVTNRVERIDNRPYTVIQLETALYPLREGIIPIAPFRIEIPETPFQSARILESEALTLEVLPLPAPPPSGFRNAVGEFQASFRQPPVSQGLVLELVIEGRGNLRQILPPELNFPQGWQAYLNPPELDFVSLDSGTRVFSWTLIPFQAGSFQIAPPSFVYFEPGSGQYREVMLAPLDLNISADQVARSDPDATVPNEATRPMPSLKPFEASSISSSLPVSVLYGFLWALPPLFFIMVLVRRQGQAQPGKVQRPHASRSSKSNAGFRKEFQETDRLPPAAALERHAQLLQRYLLQRSKQANLSAAIAELPDELSQQIRSVIDAGKAARYAPVTHQDVTENRLAIEQIMQEAERVWRKSR